MKRATAGNVRDAFGAECAAHMRYLVFSEKAGQEKFPNVARMFRALAASEKVHASGHYRSTRQLLGEYCVSFTAPFIYNRTIDNLTKTREFEKEEGEELYRPYAAAAREQNEDFVARNFEQIAGVKKCHSDMVGRVLDFIERSAEEPEIGSLYVCSVCGLVAESAAPENCPVCKAEGPGFERIE